MNFSLDEAIEVLEQTPNTLTQFLGGLSGRWLTCNEGPETWNPLEVVAHLVEAEQNNWLPRLETILKHGEREPFPSFDRFAHLNSFENQSLTELLTTFKVLRQQNLHRLHHLVEPKHFELSGCHPAFGPVKVRELLSTWVVHDLTHISQITRTMAKRYQSDVGPWREYLGILN